jgi:pyruvate/oxaloacetate carboxyltransferase
LSDARLRRCLISSKTVEISRAKFHEIQKTNNYQIIKINKTQILLKILFGARGVKFLEKRRENVQILQALR